MSISSCLEKLNALCETVPPRLLALEEARFSARPAAGKWSAKEILGHLIDSATNNHHRFIRGQFEEQPRIVYAQEAWNRYGHYQEMDSRQLVLFWQCYNRQLAALLSLLPPAAWHRLVDSGGAQPMSLMALAEDYLDHLEHHLRQILLS